MPEQRNFKTVVVLSEAFDDHLAVQLNALGHLAQSIGHQAAHLRTAAYTSYRDADGVQLGVLSWWPLIVLTGRPQRVVQLWTSLQVQDWPKACFLETMIRGGSEEQLAATSAVKYEDKKIVALATFGPSEVLSTMTKKLSLWRPSNEAANRTLLAPVSAAPTE